mgnify:FL=1
MKKESDALKAVEGEDNFWKGLSVKSLRRAWTEKDAVWDKLYKEAGE